MRVILDTNELPASILNLAIDDDFESLYDNRILREYIEILHHAKFSFKDERVEALIDYILKEAIFGP
jgi:predicted nucleic acid-binding protein